VIIIKSLDATNNILETEKNPKTLSSGQKTPKKPKKTQKNSKKTPKNPKNPKKPPKKQKSPKKPTGLFFFKNPGFFQPCVKVPSKSNV
jgi:hypothetical protein